MSFLIKTLYYVSFLSGVAAYCWAGLSYIRWAWSRVADRAAELNADLFAFDGDLGAMAFLTGLFVLIFLFGRFWAFACRQWPAVDWAFRNEKDRSQRPILQFFCSTPSIAVMAIIAAALGVVGGDSYWIRTGETVIKHGMLSGDRTLVLQEAKSVSLGCSGNRAGLDIIYTLRFPNGVIKVGDALDQPRARDSAKFNLIEQLDRTHLRDGTPRRRSLAPIGFEQLDRQCLTYWQTTVSPDGSNRVLTLLGVNT